MFFVRAFSSVPMALSLWMGSFAAATAFSAALRAPSSRKLSGLARYAR
jgi:hypothetical protein